MTTTELIHSFTTMIQNASRIHSFIEAAQADTGSQYIGETVIETMENGMTRRGVIEQIEWCESCLTKIDGKFAKGNWLIFIKYLDNDYIITPNGKKKLATAPSAWVTREALTLVGGE